MSLAVVVLFLLAYKTLTMRRTGSPSDNLPSTSNGATVAYAVSVTGCGSDPITEGAAVLKHSIHQSSSRAGVSKYDYQMYAIVHPDATACGSPLKDLGYQVLIRKTPVDVKDIKGDFLRTHIEKNGYVDFSTYCYHSSGFVSLFDFVLYCFVGFTNTH